MKLFVTGLALAGTAKGMTDCGKLNNEQTCPDGVSAPHCEEDQICFASGESDCSYSCSNRSSCKDGAKVWRSAVPSKDGGTEYVDYCAEKPLTSSYTCGMVQGEPTVSVTLLPIVKAYDRMDKREYQFYEKPFGADEYEYGMFGEASDECRSLLNKSIDADGYTTFEFVLDGPNSVRDVCNIQFSDDRDVEAEPTTPYTQTFQFAIGYEDFMIHNPFFGNILGQPGLHTNFKCTQLLSDNKTIGFGVGVIRTDQFMDDDLKNEFTMQHCTDKECTETEENPQVVLRPKDTIVPWRYFVVDNKMKNKYTHIEQCKVHFVNKDGETFKSLTYIEDGCVSNVMEPWGWSEKQDTQKDFVWISPDPRPYNPQNQETSDRFGMKVFDLPEHDDAKRAVRWEVECELKSCDYKDDNKDACGLRDNCPISDRYDNIFGKTNNRIRRSATTEKSNTVTTNFYHPCYYIETEDATGKARAEEYGWTRQICEEQGKL
jgi:hypothetical protein